MEGKGTAASLVAPLGAPVEGRDGRGPGLTVAGKALRAQVGAEGEELGKGPDGLDVTERGDADEAVRVEVVAQEDARVAVVGAEEPWLAVVQEIALVDGLEPDGKALLRERREDRLFLALGLGPKRGGPELALPPGLDGDRLPERRAR